MADTTNIVVNNLLDPNGSGNNNNKEEQLLRDIVSLLKEQKNNTGKPTPIATASSKDGKDDDGGFSKALAGSMSKKLLGSFGPLFSALHKYADDGKKKWVLLGGAVVASANVGIQSVKKVSKAYIDFAKLGTSTLLAYSKKMVTTNSLFVDSEARDMMQKTGQTAVQAQSTQRALDRLGLSFDDLQTGKLTEAQARAFEDVRNREIEKLKQLEAAGTQAFDSVQSGQMLLMQTQQDLQDMLAVAFAMAGPEIEKVFDIMETTIASLMPAVQALMPAVSEIFGTLPTIVSALVPIVNTLISALGPILDALPQLITSILVPLGPIITTLLQALMPIVEVIINIMNTVMPTIMSLLNLFSSILLTVVDSLVPLINILMNVLAPIFTALVPIFDLLSSVIKTLSPLLSLLVGTILLPFMPILMQFMAIFEVISGVLNTILPLFTFLFDILNNLMAPIKEFLNALSWMDKIMVGIKNVIQEVFSWIQGVINKFLGFLGIEIPDLNDGKENTIPAPGAQTGNNVANSSTVNSTVNYNYGGAPVTTSQGIPTANQDTLVLNLSGY